MQQDSAQANTTGITDKLKGPVQMRQSEHWGYFQQGLTRTISLALVNSLLTRA